MGGPGSGSKPKTRAPGDGWYDEHRKWHYFTPVLPDDERPAIPPTVSHDVVAEHRPGCCCDICMLYRQYDKPLLHRLKQAHIRRAR